LTFKNLYYYKPTESKYYSEKKYYDVVIYGGTPGGITAAIQVTKLGLKACVLEFGKKIGGMTASGLGATDLGAMEATGGLSLEFYKRIGKYYGEEIKQSFEPHVALKTFKNWLEEYDISVYYEQHLDKVEKVNGKIKSIMMEDGTVYEGKVFIDTSYEGDLLARAGVSYFVGRESNSTYKEIYNGIQFGGPHHKFETWIDPYIIEGDETSGLLPGIMDVSEEDIGFNGKGDKSIQAYNFRLCLTQDEKNKIEFPKPPTYNPNRYLLLLRYIYAGFWDAMNLHTMMPNGKTDLNNFGGFSSDNIGMNFKWPDGNYEIREKIFQDHLNYQLGMMYFLSNDTRVPKEVRQEVSSWGLPKDEFVDTGHWPHQLYIREARRMISDYVMTDHNCLGYRTISDSIGLASYQMDSHHCRRLVLDGRVVNEGDVQIPISPYPISYRSIRPKEEECTNLLVSVCLSSSHIAFGSIRMEPVFMILGQSAGAAAYLTIKNNTNVQRINYKELKQILTEAGQVLEWDPTIEYDPIREMEKTFGKETQIMDFD